MVANSLVAVDVHNHYLTSDGYIVIVYPTDSEIQRDIEEITKKVILRNGNELGRISSYMYDKRGEGVYTSKSKTMTLTHFAGKLGIANIGLEVPSFTRDKGGYLVQVDQARIMDTNVEMFSRIAEYVN